MPKDLNLFSHLLQGIGAVADMDRFSGMAERFIECSKEGMVTNIYPAKEGGIMVVLKNHEADNQRVTVRCPGHPAFTNSLYSWLKLTLGLTENWYWNSTISLWLAAKFVSQ